MPHGRMAMDRLEGINMDRMRKYRLQRIREAMAANGIGTLITWDPYCIRYISGGYVTVPNRYNNRQSVIVPRNGDPICSFMSSFSTEALKKEAPWLNGNIIGDFGPARDASQADVEKAAARIMGIVAEHGLSNEPIAIDGCAREHMMIESLRKMGAKDVVDGVYLCFDARSIKNVDEINCFKLACGAADAAFEDIRQAIRPGIRECDLQGIGMKRLYEMGCDETQEFVVASGPRTNPMHIDFTDRAIGPNEPVIVDINGASYMGYKTCYYRTFFCGRPNEEQKEIYEVARKMMYDGMAPIKDGADVNAVRAMWPKGPEFWGYDSWEAVRGYALGHGLGISLHESPIMFFAGPGLGPNTTFKEGMVIAVETWAGKKGGDFGVRLEEDIVVTKDGYELLTKWPVDKMTECWIG
ncbi:MAG: aminopeptidase P family protein [Clostridiales bacterium]|nr:aminopeptidase P family protein [Clostridiales bacterium]